MCTHRYLLYTNNNSLAIATTTFRLIVTIVFGPNNIGELLLSQLLCLRLLVRVPGVATLCLGQVSDGGHGKSSKNFLGLGVAVRLAVLSTVILVSLGSLVGNSAAEHVMGNITVVSGVKLVALAINKTTLYTPSHPAPQNSR